MATLANFGPATLGQRGDQAAYLFRSYNSEERAVARKQLAYDARVASGKGFYCASTQRELGLRGGAKGGFANTVRQLEARRKVGLIYGKKVVKRNQKPEMVAFLEKPSFWEHKPGILVAIPPQETFHDVLSILRECVDQPIPNETSMYKLIKKNETQNTTIYGWRILKMPIRSEIEMVNGSERETLLIAAA